MSAPLRVNFALQAIRKSGGVLVVLEYARRLRKAGHDVRVYYPLLTHGVYFNGLPPARRICARVDAFLRTLLGARAARRAAGDAGVRLVPRISDAFVRDADVTIATAWPTAYDVARLRESTGRKLYFVQGYEVWHGETEKVDASYRLPLGIVTIAPWLTRLMRERFGREPLAELHNGVDLDFFRPPEGKGDTPCVLMLYHHQEVKGIPDGLAVLRALRARHPHVRVVMFGMHDFPDKDDFIEYHRDPSREDILRLYQEAHVFLSPSLSEGWGLPAMEAMACGCAVVATRVGCIPVLESEGNVLTAEPGDRETLLAHLEALVRDPGRLREVAAKGRETVLGHGWDAKARAFERVLVEASGRGEPARSARNARAV